MEAAMTDVIERAAVGHAVPHTAGATAGEFPASRKVYVTGSRPDIRVPFREVAQSPTRGANGAVANPPLRVYDTSGAHTDPDLRVEPERGLPPLRRAWILERGDVAPDRAREGGAPLRARDAMWSPEPPQRRADRLRIWGRSAPVSRGRRTSCGNCSRCISVRGQAWFS